MGIVSQKLRDSARGQMCTLQTSYCNCNPETTILAHLPSQVKGTATKSDDFFAVFSCSACHDQLDNHRMLPEAELYYSLRALMRTHKFWRDNGYIVIVGDTEKPRKPSSKVVQRASLYRAS